MLKLIRVILGAEVDGFVSGIRRAQQALGGFVQGAAGVAAGVAAAFAGLPILINGLINSIQGLVDKVIGLGQALLEPAVSAQRFEAQAKAITGSASEAAAEYQHLSEMAMKYGLSLEELLPAGNQVNVLLRGQKGEVPIDEWERYTKLLAEFKALRPDVPMQLLGRALSGAAGGDLTTLTRALDVDLPSIIDRLDPKFKKFLETGKGAAEQQLGSVTKLGKDAEGQAGDALELLEALAEALGANEELLTGFADTWDGQIGRLMASWDHFKQIVGEPILEVLNDALDRLLTILGDHQDEIDAFAKSLGDWAAVNLDKLIDFLFNQDWEQIATNIGKVANNIKDFIESDETQKSLDALKQALLDISHTSFEGLKDFFENTDWDSIRKAIEAIADAVNAVNAYFHPEQLTPLDQAAAQYGAVVNTPSSSSGEIGGKNSLLGLTNGNSTVDSMFQEFLTHIKATLPGLAEIYQKGGDEGFRTAHGAATQVTVDINLNTEMLDGKIVSGATNVIAQFVDAKSAKGADKGFRGAHGAN